MATEPARLEATRPEPNASVPDERERMIESINQLLSAGLPLSDVLVEAKRLALSHNPDPIEKLRAGLVARAQENTRRRSEERRVGKECRYRWWPYTSKIKKAK